jgi:uncharacterized protein Smg (DUF494 family)
MDRLNQLIHLINQYILEEKGDYEQVSRRLVHAGYTLHEIDAALEWQTGPEDIRVLENLDDDTFNLNLRMFTPEEKRLLTKKAQGFIIEQLYSRRIDLYMLEEIMEKLQQLPMDEITIDDLQLFLSMERPELEDHSEIKTKFVSFH